VSDAQVDAMSNDPDPGHRALLESRRLRAEAEMTRRDAQRARDAIEPYCGPDRRRHDRVLSEAPFVDRGNASPEARPAGTLDIGAPPTDR
jgi:hypothetical protein